MASSASYSRPRSFAASPQDRAELLAGAAGQAAALFGAAAAQDDDVAGALLDPSFAIMHGL
jgi:hypothetical protein